MSNNSEKYHFDLGIGEQASLYGQDSKGLVDFETNLPDITDKNYQASIISGLLHDYVANLNFGVKNPFKTATKRLEKTIKQQFSNPSLSFSVEGGNVHPALEDWYATLGANVYATSPKHRTEFDELQDLMLTIGYRFNQSNEPHSELLDNFIKAMEDK
mgnify:CR=1 FL=1